MYILYARNKIKNNLKRKLITKNLKKEIVYYSEIEKIVGKILKKIKKSTDSLFGKKDNLNKRNLLNFGFSNLELEKMTKKIFQFL